MRHMGEFDPRYDFVGPHELHVTVAPDSDPELFATACADLGVKSHVIYNEVPGGETIVDYLTGSEINCRSSKAFTELGWLAAGLESVGLEVVRKKIETIPDHPASPKTPLDRMEVYSYFECHFTLPDLPTMHGFQPMGWNKIPFLLSTTQSKRERGELFATMRHYIATADTFVKGVDDIYMHLSGILGDIKQPTVEFALYDDNPDHDKQWVDAYRNTRTTE